MLSFYLLVASLGIVHLYDSYNNVPRLQAGSYNTIYPLYVTLFNGYIQSYLIDSFAVYKLETNYTFANTLFAPIIYFILQDIYFYITHRLAHTFLYKYFHKMHHTHKAPDIFTTFYENPIEHILIWTMPYMLPHMIGINQISYWLFVFYTTFLSVIGHCGSNYKANIWYAGYIWNAAPISHYYTFGHSYHHDIHHEKTNCNYGLWFTFMDEQFGTQYENYKSYIPLKFH